MTAVTHQLIALTAAFWLLIIYPHEAGAVLATIVLIAVMVGALTPDLDQPAANLGNRLLGAHVVGKIFNRFSGGHRHFTHSILGIFIIGYGLRWLLAHLLVSGAQAAAHFAWMAFMIGYVSHLAADTVTDRGVPWLWPLPWHFQIPPGPKAVRVTTGSLVERVIWRGGLVVALVIMLWSHWSTLINLWH